MHALAQHFDDLLKAIQPPEDRLAAAQEIPGDVRRFLEEREDYPTVPPHTRLIGSYARHTTTGDIKDVDFVVHYDGSTDESPKAVIQRLRGVLDDFPGFLEGHGSTEVSASRRSVHVLFEDRDFHLDVVPAIAPDGLAETIYIPDREQMEWIESKPVGYIDWFTGFNDEHGGKPRLLVKLLKHWRDEHMSIRLPKSYWLEAIVVMLVRDSKVDTTQPIAVGFRDLLVSIDKRFAPILGHEGATPNLPDPMLGNNVSPDWERSHFETFMRRVGEAKQKAIRAIDATERDDAIRLWQEIFGEEHFPTDVGTSAREVAQQLAPGRSFVTGVGTLTAARLTPAATPIRSTRYYGDAQT